MIYWDNAATTWPKPTTVRVASCKANLLYGANPGRSGHKMSLRAAEQLYLCRNEVADFFGLPDPIGVIFTANCTTALNMVIKGVMSQEGRVLVSDLEHNAVMRPLEALSANASRYDVVSWCLDEDELVERFRLAIRPDTRLLVCTHASNVFGVTLPIRRLGELAHRYGLLFCVDAAQSAGVLPLNMEDDHIDYLCIAPHKGLYAPMGTGLLLCREGDAVEPLIRGGTGSQSLSLQQPTDLPDRLESGTPNTAGICGMRAGVEFVRNMGRERVYQHEIRCLQCIYDHLCNCAAIRFYTPRPRIGKTVPVMSVNIADLPSERAAELLDEQGIAVRSGLHCAPMAHRHFDTVHQGTVRLAPSAFSTLTEAENISEVFLKIAEKSLH